MRKEAYGGWVEKPLTQEEAGALLAVCPRSFRLYLERLREADESWIELLVRRPDWPSHRAVPENEVMALVQQYQDGHPRLKGQVLLPAGVSVSGWVALLQLGAHQTAGYAAHLGR